MVLGNGFNRFYRFAPSLGIGPKNTGAWHLRARGLITPIIRYPLYQRAHADVIPRAPIPSLVD